MPQKKDKVIVTSTPKLTDPNVRKRKGGASKGVVQKKQKTNEIATISGSYDQTVDDPIIGSQEGVHFSESLITDFSDFLVKRLESDIHDLKLELSYLKKNGELRKEQEYKHIMDLKVKPTGKTMHHPKNNSGLTCFHCKEKGHRYFECNIASPFQIEHIKANFSSYLAAFKKDLRSGNNSENSNGVASRSSR